MKKYLFIIPVLLIIYFCTLDYQEEFDNNLLSQDSINNSKELENKELENSSKPVKVSYNGENLTMDVDDYVLGVLACEMPASFNEEALKAGAVVARTFYFYKLLNNDAYVAKTTDQCFINELEMREKWKDDFDKYYNILKNIVNDTSGEFVSYNGDIIESFYFSMSNGYTENVENVFGASRPYLVSVDSSWDKGLNSYQKEEYFTKSEFLDKLGLEDSSDINIDIISKNESGRINTIKVNGKVFKGTDFRKKLGIRSTDAVVEVLENKVKIVTKGYGHGVGLSQYGANEMAKLGYNYKDIIKHYYVGTEISKL